MAASTSSTMYRTLTVGMPVSLRCRCAEWPAHRYDRAMNRSTTRTLATHVGSLPRPRDLLATLLEKEGGRAVDEDALDARVQEAVTEVVGLQRDRGIDVVNDGEIGKPGFIAYVNDRLGGFEPSRDSRAQPGAGPARRATSPSSTRRPPAAAPARAPHMRRHRPGRVQGPRRAARRHRQPRGGAKDGAAPTEVFMPAISPTNVERWQRERLLQDPGGVPLRDRRGDARGVPGHHRCRLPAPDRRPAAGDVLRMRAD